MTDRLTGQVVEQASKCSQNAICCHQWGSAHQKITSEEGEKQMTILTPLSSAQRTESNNCNHVCIFSLFYAAESKVSLSLVALAIGVVVQFASAQVMNVFRHRCNRPENYAWVMGRSHGFCRLHAACMITSDTIGQPLSYPYTVCCIYWNASLTGLLEWLINCQDSHYKIQWEEMHKRGLLPAGFLTAKKTLQQHYNMNE